MCIRDSHSGSVGQDHAELGRDFIRFGDAAAQHIPALAGQAQVGRGFALAAQVRQQVGTAHLDFVHGRFRVRLHRGVADGEDIRHGHRPLRGGLGRLHRYPQAQATPGQPAGALHLLRHARHQAFVFVQRATVACPLKR